MLSRDLCEKLAEAYPEDLRHIPQKGDLCYVSSLMDESLLYVGASGPTSEGWGARTFHFVSVLNGTEFDPEAEAQFRLHLRTGPMPGNVWDVRGDADIVVCPRLEDLLAVATDKANSMGNITLNLTCATWSPHWELSVRKADMAVTDDIMFHEIAAIGFTDTPEEAVAIWLLQVADQRKEGWKDD